MLVTILSGFDNTNRLMTAPTQNKFETKVLLVDIEPSYASNIHRKCH